MHDPVVDDVRDFQRLDTCLADIGINSNERFCIYAIVMAVLHIGNISFIEDHDDTHGGCHIPPETDSDLVMAAGLLGIDSEELRMGLTSRVMQATKAGAKGTIIR